MNKYDVTNVVSRINTLMSGISDDSMVYGPVEMYQVVPDLASEPDDYILRVATAIDKGTHDACYYGQELPIKIDTENRVYLPEGCSVEEEYGGGPDYSYATHEEIVEWFRECEGEVVILVDMIED